MGLKIFRKKPAARARQSFGIKRPSSAFSYYANDNARPKDNVRARQASEQRTSFVKKLRLIPTLIAIFVIVLSIVYGTTLTTAPIVKFVGEASLYHTRNDYEQGIASLLQGSFGNHNKITMNAGAAAEEIKKKYPEIDIATVSLPIIGRRPTVTLHARTPALVLTSAGGSFIVDSDGVVVSESNLVSSSLLEKLPTVQDQSNVPLKLGSQALTRETIIFITNATAQLADKQLGIASMMLIAGGYELDIHIKDLSYYIKTDSSGDARLQIGDFLAVKETGIKPAEYVDVRIEEKVFYR